MLKQNFLLAIRRLIRNGWHSVITISGLAIGLASVILMLFYIDHETSYDSFNPNYDRLFRVERSYLSKSQSEIWDSNPYSLSEELKSSMPEVENAAGITHTSNYLTFDEGMYHETQGLYADHEFLNIFSFKFINGNKREALKKPLSIILSESLANKLYPDENILGQTIRVDKKHDCVVTGVFTDFPTNSHLEMDYLISYASYEEIEGKELNTEYNSSVYVQLNENADENELSRKIVDFLSTRYVQEEGVKELLSLRHVGDIYLKTSKIRGNTVGARSEVTIIYLFLAVAIFTGLITALNYVNSSTAQVMGRELEIGIKKVMGSSQMHLIYQFVAEALVAVFVSFIVAVLIVLLVLPFFNAMVDKNLTIIFEEDWMFFLKAMLGVLLVGFLSGLYPVFFLSSLKISSFLHGNASIKRRAVLRKVLVVFQLVVAMPLIFTSILITEQINYLLKKDIGFVKEDLLVARIETTDDQEMERLRSIKTTLLQNPDVLNFSISNSAPFNGGAQKNVNWDGSDANDKISLRSHSVDYDFLDTYQMTLVKGRGFSKEHATDVQSACIINETALKLFGWENPIGKTIDNGQLEVIGVIKDFNDYTLFKEIPPMVLTMNKIESNPLVSIKVKSDKRAEMLGIVSKLFDDNFPETPLEFKYLDSEFDSSFLNALRGVTRIFVFFSILAILLAVLGLYSLVSFSLKTQKKMIAIRKVLGANLQSLFLLILKEYLGLFAISSVIGLLTIYFAAGKLMNVFAYHVEVKFLYLVLAALLALFVVLVSVSSKIWLAAKENPIDSIASE